MSSLAKVAIYGAEYCSFCVKAKNLLLKNKVPINWVDVENEEGRKTLLDLQLRHNYKTIPMIFVNDAFIGGFTDLKAKLDNNELKY
jgi:glutaredoxin 3